MTRLRFGLLAFSILVSLKPATAGAAEAISSPAASISITVFECVHDAGSPPVLRVTDIDKILASVPVTPQWYFQEPVWKTTISVPSGHYIFHARTKHCTGESEQLVAIPGIVRHLTITLDEKDEQAPGTIQSVKVDEDMYASAVYGVLPSAIARVELMSLTSPIGEQTRQTAKVDGDVYEFDHLMPGRYVVRIVYGDILVSREVIIPSNVYGAVVRADLTAEEASRIVQVQASGSGFVSVENYAHEQEQRLRLGSAVVDGWTNQLIPPSDYNTRTLRLNVSLVHALDVTRGFLISDRRIPTGFRSLSAWSVQLRNAEPNIIVNLLPTNVASWVREGPEHPLNCYIPELKHYVIVAVNDQTWAIDEVAICP